jgi:hypothetical protein
MAAADEGADWSLVNFAKQVFGAKPAAPEVGFNFVEPVPEEEKPASTAAETDEVVAPDNEPAAEEDETAREEPITAIETPEIAVTEVQDVPPTEAAEPGTGKDGRQLRTAGEMADMVLNVLRADGGVPERGFVVTVYGSRPWNAMLTIKPEAGAIRDARLWRERVQEIGAQLRRDFDVIHEMEDTNVDVIHEIEDANVQSPGDSE